VDLHLHRVHFLVAFEEGSRDPLGGGRWTDVIRLAEIVASIHRKVCGSEPECRRISRT